MMFSIRSQHKTYNFLKTRTARVISARCNDAIAVSYLSCRRVLQTPVLSQLMHNLILHMVSAMKVPCKMQNHYIFACKTSNSLNKTISFLYEVRKIHWLSVACSNEMCLRETSYNLLPSRAYFACIFSKQGVCCISQYRISINSFIYCCHWDLFCRT